ncbi:MAG: Na+/H+ antiporter NhaC family protein [Akkermansia sp.]|nr:Na+/H+ antiporter NhaC family protein [Akkermansia sp.]
MARVREIPVRNRWQGLVALSPLAVFFTLYLAVSLAAGDFYKMPVTVAFVAACAWAFAVCRPRRLQQCVARFSAGAGHPNIALMVWIFVLAGAFAESAKYIGAVDATVALTLCWLPAGLVLPGLFAAACLISLSIGTSVGTIVALMPVAAGVAAQAGIPLPTMAGVIVGGAFFGDNLSFISDTTIAATRSQGCSMKDKFRANLRLALPAALITMAAYGIMGAGHSVAVPQGHILWWRALPYLLILATAMAGVNVMLVLMLGLLGTGLVALCAGGLGLLDWAGAMGKGITGMGELVIVTLLAGGLLELIRYNGGFTYVVQQLTRRIRTRRMAELCMAIMVVFANFCTANNTIAILSVGQMARRIAHRFHIPPTRAASLLDTFSCTTQGILPYGAQLLMCSALAGIGTLEIIPCLYYPMLLGLVAGGSILLQRGRR